jgi:hypothetical protein
MKDRAPREKIPLQIVSREQAKTELGAIVKFDVLVQGQPRTFYSIPGLTNTGILREIADIESANELAKSPSIVRNLENRGKTLEERIEEGSRKYIEDIREGGYTDSVQDSSLFPLFQQKAYKDLFTAARNL